MNTSDGEGRKMVDDGGGFVEQTARMVVCIVFRRVCILFPTFFHCPVKLLSVDGLARIPQAASSKRSSSRRRSQSCGRQLRLNHPAPPPATTCLLCPLQLRRARTRR